MILKLPHISGIWRGIKDMFKFHLETVLNHRRNIEDGRQKELSFLKQAMDNELKTLDILKNARIAFSRELKDKQSKRITASESMLYHDYLDLLSEKIDQQKKRLQEVEKEVERKREELIVAMKDRKVLENLRKKNMDRYLKEVNRKEREFINEMATVRFNPKVNEF